MVRMNRLEMLGHEPGFEHVCMRCGATSFERNLRPCPGENESDRLERLFNSEESAREEAKA